MYAFCSPVCLCMHLDLKLPSWHSLLQVLAVYDKAGRLLRGHPTAPRDVVDYVVVERHIVSPSSSWRVAGKLPPNTSYNTGQGEAKALPTAS